MDGPHYIQAEISPVDLTLTGFYAWDGYMQWCTKNKLDLYASWLAAGILDDGLKFPGLSNVIVSHVPNFEQIIVMIYLPHY